MPKPEDNQKASTPVDRAGEPKPPTGKGADDAPVQTEPNKPNDEVVDPRGPG